MSSGYLLKELTAGPREIYRAAVEIYQSYLEALARSRTFKGGMHWKRIRGRDYLYRYRDRFGHGESLGPRSEQTERLFAQFDLERRDAAARLLNERLRLKEQAGVCRAARINRAPRAAARILRRLDAREAGGNFLVIGSTALYAYEAAAGVFLDPAGGPNRPGAEERTLTLLGGGSLAWEEFLQLLRRTDRSFAPLPAEGGRAVNRDGFRVHLLQSGARRPGKQKTITVPGAVAPLPPEAGNPTYLASAAKFAQVVIGQDGLPAAMTVADPRAFALNKFWLSEQEDREEAKRTRDRSQARAVAALVLRYLPEYDFFSTDLDMLPQDLVQSAARVAEGAEANGEDWS